ncbi:MAG TPA: NUDIX domain-containing protein [Spirochaetia bacterium]|nr:NUDIX domain-containing protein [Spirochaetia bacterium]
MTEIDRYIEQTNFTPAVVGFLREGNRVLLGERIRVSAGLGQNLIAGIGGKVGDSEETKDETLEQAMDREMFEEVGVKILEKIERGRLRFVFMHKDPNSKWNQDVKIYEITEWEGEPVETESTKPSWFDEDKIPWEKMWEDNEHWLPLVLSGKKIDAVFLFSDDNKVAEYRFDEGV